MIKEANQYQEILNTFSRRGRLAVAASIAGGEAVVAIGQNKNTSTKDSQHNLVTDGDRASEAAVISVIREAFPEDLILSEETASDIDDLLAVEHLWIIDPIDGTFNFANGIPYFGVSVGYAERGIIKTGAVLNPITGDLYFAEEGRGAYKNGERISVSDVVDLSKAKVETDLPFDQDKRRLNQTISRDLNLFTHVRGSLVLNAARVASGEADLYYLTAFGGPWDLAAVTSIVEEAGGVTYDFEGNNLTHQRGSFLAKSIVYGNPEIVANFLKAVKPIIETNSE